MGLSVHGDSLRDVAKEKLHKEANFFISQAGCFTQLHFENSLNEISFFARAI